jgi:hypothetical protein
VAEMKEDNLQRRATFDALYVILDNSLDEKSIELVELFAAFVM